MIRNFCRYKTSLGLGWMAMLLAILTTVEAAGQELTPRSDTLSPGLDSSLFQPPSAPVENRVNYSRSILNQSFDFQLEPISDGKFEINISGSPRTDLNIRVYDIIGNLIYEDAVRIRGFLQKKLDLSDYKSNFFIIEIGNKDVNKTKSIVAI